MPFENEIRQIMSRHLALSKPIETIDLDANLQDIGFNSISFIKLIVAIEARWNVEFPDDKLLVNESGTLRQLCEMVRSMV